MDNTEWNGKNTKNSRKIGMVGKYPMVIDQLGKFSADVYLVNTEKKNDNNDFETVAQINMEVDWNAVEKTKYWVTKSTSVSPFYQGKGLAPKMYAALCRKGMTLRSDDVQSAGGKKIWIALSKIPGITVYAGKRLSNGEWELSDIDNDVDDFLRSGFQTYDVEDQEDTNLLQKELKQYRDAAEKVGDKLVSIVKDPSKEAEADKLRAQIQDYQKVIDKIENEIHKNMNKQRNMESRDVYLFATATPKKVNETIRKVKGGYRLVSKKGKNLGTYPSKSGAEKREKQVQYFKHANESANQVRGSEPMPKKQKPSKTGTQKHPYRGRLVGEDAAQEPDSTGYQHDLLTMPANTLVIDTEGDLDWYKLGQHIANLNKQDPHEWGQGDSDMVITLANQDQVDRLKTILDRFGATYKDVGGSHAHPEIHKSANGKIDELKIQTPPPKDTLGVPRRHMPQIEEEHYKNLFKHLHANGATVKKVSVDARDLDATQAEFSDKGIEKSMTNGKMNKPIIISSDNYVLDGHHRWLAAKNGRKHNITAFKLSVPAKEGLSLLINFPKATFKDIHESESIDGKQMLKLFYKMHHDAGNNDEMDQFILSHNWKLGNFTPDMFPSEEEFFDYDDPFDRIIDIDYGHRVDLSQPIIAGPKFSDGKFSVIDGNHRAASAQKMGKTIKAYFPVSSMNESVIFEANEDVRTFANQLEKKYDLQALFLSDLGERNAIEISSIIVKKENQRSGSGSAAMNEIIRYADQHGKILVLTPGLYDKRHGTTSQSRLTKFYKRFGFIENKGRNKNYEFRQSMIRYPQNMNEAAGVGKIVKGVNTTVDVGPNEIVKQAAKFGNKVSKDGKPKLNLK